MQLAASDANEIVEYLEENRYIDDSRFARAFARDKVKFSGWGKNKIRMALAMKRIPSAEISSALEEIDPEEYMAVAVNAAKAKARNLDLSDYDDKGKLYRHLASRGFEGSVISKAIQSIV